MYGRRAAGDIPATTRQHRRRVPPGQGVFAPIELPGAKATTPIKVNARGQIVGVFSEVTDRRPLRPPFNGFLLDGGLFTRIEVPGAASTFPSASERKFDIGGRGSAP
jgi:hypothetical protein